jgi:hypothetical protein
MEKINLTKMLNKDNIIKLAKETKFCIRIRKVDPNNFLNSLVFCSSKQLPVSLRNLASLFDKIVSRTSIHKKFNEKATLFMQKCFQHILAQKIEGCEIQTSFFKKFLKILIIDSSTWNISQFLKDVFPGSGGSASDASSKMQLTYEYKTGSINSIDVESGKSNDQGYAKNLPAKIGEKFLVLFDLGYWSVDLLMKIQEKKAFYVARLKTDVNLWLKDDDGFFKIVLEKILKGQSNPAIEFDAYLKKKHKTRIITFRVPEELAKKRQEKLKKIAAKKKGKGHKVSEKSLALCHWSIFVTNCDEKLLSGEMIRSVYRIRWTIELIFKTWKSILKIDECNAITNVDRFKCELYGKLILAVLITNIYQITNFNLWENEKKEISFSCVANYVIDHSKTYFDKIKLSVEKFSAYVNSSLNDIMKNCEKYHQPSRKTVLQRIDEMIGDAVPVKI